MAESKRYVNHRCRQMSATRKVLHALHVHRDFNIRMYEGWGRGNERGSDRQSIRRGAAQGELDMATRLAAKALADITPRAQQELKARQTIGRNARQALERIETRDLRRDVSLTI